MSGIGAGLSALTGNPLPLILGGIKKGALGLFRWLRTLSVWQLGCLVLSIFVLVQHFNLTGERRHSAKVELNAAKAKKADKAIIDRMTAEVVSLAQQSAAKQAQTRIIVKRGADHIVVVEKDAKRVETAPLAGNCKSSTITMGADL